MIHRGFWSLLCLAAVALWTYSIYHFTVEEGKYKFAHVRGIVKASQCWLDATTWEVFNDDYLEVEADIDGNNQTVVQILYGLHKKHCYRIGDSIDVCVLYYQAEFVDSALKCRFGAYMGHIAGFIIFLVLGLVMMGTGLYFSLGLRKCLDKR